MRKIHLLIGITLFSLMTGCGNAGQSQGDIQNEKEKIVIWSYYETKAQQDGLDWLVNNFNLYQNKYEATWEYVPMTDFTKKLAMAYTEEALPDIALLDNPNMMACVQMGMCEEMTDFTDSLGMEEAYYPATVETVTYNEETYGLPAVCNNLALIYNVDMLKEAGVEPPQTWEELEQAAKALTTKEHKGFLMSAKEGEQGAFQILPWILSTGEPVDEIGGDGTIKAFTYLEGLMEQGYMTRNCVNLSQTDVATAFVNGETAMMENGPWVFSMLDQSNVSYGVSRLPVDQKSSVVVGGEDFTIMKGKNVQGAEAFLQYYDRDEVMGAFCEKTGVLPPKEQVEGYKDDRMDIFREQMQGAVVRSSIPHWITLSDALPESFYEMVSGQRDSKTAANVLKVDNN